MLTLDRDADACAGPSLFERTMPLSKADQSRAWCVFSRDSAPGSPRSAVRSVFVLGQLARVGGGAELMSSGLGIHGSAAKNSG